MLLYERWTILEGPIFVEITHCTALNKSHDCCEIIYNFMLYVLKQKKKQKKMFYT